MHPFLFYILQTIAIAGIFYAYYVLILRNIKLYRFNRFYLLTGVVLSLVIPLVQIEWATVAPEQKGTAIRILQAIQTGGYEETAKTATTPSILLVDILMFLYLLKAAVSLTVMAINIYKLHRVKKLSAVTREGNANIIHTDLAQAPFCFFNNLYWNRSIDMASETGGAIMRHELTHITQKHTWDKLFTKLVLAFFWMNPFFRLMEKELSMTHEFLADEQAVNNRDTELFATMLLQSHFGGKFPAFVQPFFSSPIKRRIIMMQKTNKTSFARLRMLAVLPVLATTLALFSFSVKEQQVEKSKHKTTIVLDAGHGGQDLGASGIDGVSEKDLCLAVTKEIKRLAAEYNVEVITTRNADKSVKLEDRVKTGTGNGAQIFLSIHVNKDAAGEEKHTGYEVYVSGKNSKHSQSMLLASAIVGKLNTLPVATKLLDKGHVVLRTNQLPSVLIECGNIDNPQDVARLTDDKQREEMCRKLLSGIVAYSNSSN